MKKLKIILIILVLISMLFILAGCTTTSNAETKERFIRISGDYVCVYYDIQTKVEYGMVNNRHGGTALVVLVDAEGKPLLYEGD